MSQPVATPDLGLTEEQLAQVGRVMLLWGAAEFHVSAALCSFAGLAEPMRDDLINSIGFSRKVDLLKKHSPQAQFRELIDELKHAATNFKPERDTLAHGMAWPAIGPLPGAVVAVAKKREVDPSELQRIVDRAAFTAMVAMELNIRTKGQDWLIARPIRPA
jgi:hypothetical protein